MAAAMSQKMMNLMTSQRTSWSLLTSCSRSSNVAVMATRVDSMTSQESRPMEDMPGPGGFPFFGSWFKYKFCLLSCESYHDNLMVSKARYGSIFKETIAGNEIVHLFDPDDFKVVYTHSKRAPHTTPLLEPSKYYRVMRKLGPGLGNVNGEKWQKLRSSIQSVMMRPQATETFFPLANEVVDDFIERMHKLVNISPDGHINNFKNELLKWNFESAFNIFMGTRMGSFHDDPDPRIQSMIECNAGVFDVTNKLNYSLGWYHYLPTPAWREHVSAEDTYFTEANVVLEQALEDLSHADSDKSRYQFLVHCLKQTAITPEHLRTFTISSTFDGMNTTVPTLIGQLYCLATNQDKQQRLYEEVRGVLPNKTDVLKPEHLNMLPYLKQCFKEGFRFFPIGAEITRVPEQDIVIAGYKIPAGTRIDIHTASLLKDAKYFDQPEIYSPERWSRDNRRHTTGAINQYASIPFGFGTRMCVAKKLAELEMYSIVVRLIQNYRVEWPHQRHMGQIHKVLLFPDTEPDFKFIRRSSS